ncbi:hypothetical protein K491DRAFT_718104 [Lophiostoma macrostomum CBS 122681]|uniref:BTB domain-containing protein n=1 Tax=Lophiostoma macrostomum CBS 122681 TaxID=1314788 RepID=A0A6A6T0Z4_9PLEO|nr:hypothetical protein K491DRAFT_718104 [Lophiostoma macrostomum CBS 122681]
MPLLPLRPSQAAQDGIIITFEIGPDHVKYQVHRNLLTHYSEYFQKALSRPWRESEDSKVVLDDIDPSTFDVFINWLYHQNVPSTLDDWLPYSEKGEDWHGTPQAWNLQLQLIAQAIIRTIAFGDRFMAHGFHSAVSNVFHDMSTTWYNFSNATVLCAFDNLHSDHALLDCIVARRCKGGIVNRILGRQVPNQGITDDQLPYDFLLRAFETYGDMVDVFHYMPHLREQQAETDLQTVSSPDGQNADPDLQSHASFSQEAYSDETGSSGW